MKAYIVKYCSNVDGELRSVSLPAKNKADAYDKAVYEIIPEKEGACPYSAWVDNVTYNNGNVKYFNTCEGLPY